MHSKKKNKTALIIFAKYPVKGKVKTRLSETLGDSTAFELYQNLAENTFKIAAALTNSLDVFLFYSNSSDKIKVSDWVNYDFEYFPQEGLDLGERMSNAFHFIFNSGYDSAMIIGTDVPDHSVEALSVVNKYLKEFDVVVGPSRDGGYYLLGMNKYYPRLFTDIKWSTSEVTDKTLQKIEAEKLSKKILPELNDIDTEEDLHDWINSNKGSAELKSKLNKLLKTPPLSEEEECSN